MGIFKDQFLSVVEWNETDDNQIFYKFPQDEIKRNSQLIVRPGQNAVFLHNGAVEGVCDKPGRYNIESDIIPIISTLKGFKFGFDTGMRADVVFINVKEFNDKWGTKQPVILQNPALPGGMPIRVNGGYQFKVSDFGLFTEKIAGIKARYTTEDIKERVTSMLEQLMMKHIATEGKDIFNLQASAVEISQGIMTDLDAELKKIGITVTGFQINSVSYPKEVQEMQNKVAGQAMVGDVNKYTQISAADAMSNSNTGTGQMAGAMMGMQMGAVMGQQMVQQMNNNNSPAPQAQGGASPNFCPNCGTKIEGANFCPNCGMKLG